MRAAGFVARRGRELCYLQIRTTASRAPLSRISGSWLMRSPKVGGVYTPTMFGISARINGGKTKVRKERRRGPHGRARGIMPGVSLVCWAACFAHRCEGLQSRPRPRAAAAAGTWCGW